MATVPKGPGQQEVTGDLRDPRTPEPVGTYKDPQSGAELTVTMGAGADALVRMGWELQASEVKKVAPKEAEKTQAVEVDAKPAEENVTKKEDK